MDDQPVEEGAMTVTYTFDVFSSLDGFGAATGNWSGTVSRSRYERDVEMIGTER